MHDQKDQRPQKEECLQWQLDIEEWQFDRAFEQQITVRHRAGGYGKIKESEQIAEPQTSADARGIDDGIAQCPQILRLGDERCRLRFLWQQVPVPSRQHAAPRLLHREYTPSPDLTLC